MYLPLVAEGGPGLVDEQTTGHALKIAAVTDHRDSNYEDRIRAVEVSLA